MKPDRLLLIDPDPVVRTRVTRDLAQVAPFEVICATDAQAAVKTLASEKAGFDLALATWRPGQSNGLEVVLALHRVQPHLPVIVLGEPNSAASATEVFRNDGQDFLTSDQLVSELPAALKRIAARRRPEDEQLLLRRQLERPYGYDEIIGASLAMQKVFATIEQIADADVDVLVTGPTGTGKDLVARAIHRRSQRASKPFVPVDCGAIPENLMESELFGHERAAFTGADSRRIGLLEYADGGTVFLDELGELPLLLQSKLLRTLQERKIRRVGGREEIPVDVRVVAATARDLDDMIRGGTFRQDLYYRVNVVRIELPPLSERGDDIGLLAEYFATRASREMKRPLLSVTPEAFQVLRQYSWPGNVRELQNVIRRGAALAKKSMISLEELPDELVVASGRRSAPGEQGYFQLRDEYVMRFERDYLTSLLARHQGDVKAAAAEAKMPRGTLYRLLKAHGLDGAAFRKS